MRSRPSILSRRSHRASGRGASRAPRLGRATRTCGRTPHRSGPRADRFLSPSLPRRRPLRLAPANPLRTNAAVCASPTLRSFAVRACSGHRSSPGAGSSSEARSSQRVVATTAPGPNFALGSRTTSRRGASFEAGATRTRRPGRERGRGDSLGTARRRPPTHRSSRALRARTLGTTAGCGARFAERTTVRRRPRRAERPASVLRTSRALRSRAALGACARHGSHAVLRTHATHGSGGVLRTHAAHGTGGPRPRRRRARLAPEPPLRLFPCTAERHRTPAHDRIRSHARATRHARRNDARRLAADHAGARRRLGHGPGGLQPAHLGRREIARRAERQVPQHERPVANPIERLHGQRDRLAHAPHLAIAPFANRELDRRLVRA